MVYAKGTSVNVDKTRIEIEGLLRKHGADRLANFSESGKAIVVFEAKGRRLRFDLPLPTGTTNRDDQRRRERWRALLLCIKAKLESVASGIETFEEAFLAHVVLADGTTVYEQTRERIEIAYKGGDVGALLPPPRSGA